MYRPSMDHPRIATPQGSVSGGSQFFNDAGDDELEKFFRAARWLHGYRTTLAAHGEG